MTTVPHADVYIARQLIEIIEDRPWCYDTNEHTTCMVAPTAARWPEPNPIHDIDDPDWTAI